VTVDENDPIVLGETRIDRWLCAVRLVKTRPMATQLCEGGHVRINGNSAKPSTSAFGASSNGCGGPRRADGRQTGLGRAAIA
jgi:hypothetical protein